MNYPIIVFRKMTLKENVDFVKGSFLFSCKIKTYVVICI